MKKTTRIFAALVATIMICCMYVTPANAASTTPLKQRSTQQTNNLVNAGAYYGWSSEQKVTVDTAKKVVTSIKLRNSKWSLSVTQTTAIKSGRINTTFQIGTGVYSITGIKSTLKKYAVGTDKRSVLEDKAAVAATNLGNYAGKMNWATSYKSSYKKGKATQTVTFKNSKYQFTATVTCYRKSGKIVTSYLRDGKSSTAKAVKSWLKQYKQ